MGRSDRAYHHYASKYIFTVMSLLDYTFMGNANFAILQCIIVKMGVIYTWQSDLLVQREYGKPHILAFQIK